MSPWTLDRHYIIALLYFPADIPTQARRGALSSWPSRAAAVIGTDTNLHLHERFSVQEVNALFLAVQLTQPRCCTASPSAALFIFLTLYCISPPLPPTPSPYLTSLLPRSSPPSTSLHKGADLLETWHHITSYSNTRHIPSRQGWTRHPSRRKRVPHVGKRVRDSPHSHC